MPTHINIFLIRLSGNILQNDITVNARKEGYAIDGAFSFEGAEYSTRPLRGLKIIFKYNIFKYKMSPVKGAQHYFQI